MRKNLRHHHLSHALPSGGIFRRSWDEQHFCYKSNSAARRRSASTQPPAGPHLIGLACRTSHPTSPVRYSPRQQRCKRSSTSTYDRRQQNTALSTHFPHQSYSLFPPSNRNLRLGHWESTPDRVEAFVATGTSSAPSFSTSHDCECLEGTPYLLVYSPSATAVSLQPDAALITAPEAGLRTRGVHLVPAWTTRWSLLSSTAAAAIELSRESRSVAARLEPANAAQDTALRSSNINGTSPRSFFNMSTAAAANPRRRPARAHSPSLNPALIESFQNMSLRKGDTFHSPTNVGKVDVWDPLESRTQSPPMPPRSGTCPKSLEDLLIGAGDRRTQDLFKRVDKAVETQSKLALAHILTEPEVLPVPTFMVRETTGQEGIRKSRTHSHGSDSGIGTSIAGSEESIPAKAPTGEWIPAYPRLTLMCHCSFTFHTYSVIL